MSIKITIQEALDANASCDTLIKKTFPAKTSFNLVRLKKELATIEKTFFETRDATINKYAIKNEKGENDVQTLEDGQAFLSVAPEDRENFTKELLEVLKQEIELPEIYFNIEDFGTELVVAEDLIGLLPFINE